MNAPVIVYLSYSYIVIVLYTDTFRIAIVIVLYTDAFRIDIVIVLYTFRIA